MHVICLEYPGQPGIFLKGLNLFFIRRDFARQKRRQFLVLTGKLPIADFIDDHEEQLKENSRYENRRDNRKQEQGPT